MGNENHTQGKPEVKPDRTWILQQFKSRGLTQKDVAEQMDVDPATLSYTIKGDRKLNLNDLKALSEILRLPAAEIMHRWGYDMRLENPTVPLRFYVRDDMLLEPAPEPCNLIPAPPGLATDSYAVQVRTTEHPNSYLNGMMCFIPAGIYEIPHAIGQLVVATTTQGQDFFGELSRGYSAGGASTYNLTHPLSKVIKADLLLERVQPVSWMKRG